jgi:hypothetical protein
LPEPELSVVVCSTGGPTVAPTLESTRASVQEAGLAAEVLAECAPALAQHMPIHS